MTNTTATATTASKATETILIRKHAEPFSSTGVAFRAFFADGRPLYLGAETIDALKASVAAERAPRIVVFELDG